MRIEIGSGVSRGRATGDRQWKTFSRRDPEFQSYLDGTFSKNLVALPVRSLNVGTNAEQVTFEIVPANQIQRPGSMLLAWTLARPSSLAFSVAPMLTVLIYLLSQSVALSGPERWIALSS